MMQSAIEQSLLTAVLPVFQHVFILIYSDADLRYILHSLINVRSRFKHES